MSSRAPGKVILSGEHAVVYGCPALVAAVNRPAWADASLRDDGQFVVACDRFGHRSHRLTELASGLEQTRQHLEEHRSGKRPAATILRHPLDLFAAVAGLLMEEPGLVLPAAGVTLTLRSHIPAGCGMGSSAALILVTLDALSALAGYPLPGEDVDRLALEAEHVQHGRSSGVDPLACRRGGVVWFEEQRATREEIDLPQAWLIDTGQPSVSTGTCVAEVRRRFANHAIWQQFRATTTYLLDALREHRHQDWIHSLRKNHELLRYIGVVPQRVDDFVHHVERAGGGGKICGAGATEGDQGGIVLVSGPHDPTQLAEQAGYPCTPLEIDHHGLRQLPDQVNP